MNKFISTLLSLVLLLASNVALAQDQGSSCERGTSLCATLYQNDTLYIEAASQAFPETTKYLLSGDNIFQKIIEGSARSFYVTAEMLTTALSDTKIQYTAIDVYFDHPADYDTFISEYIAGEKSFEVYRFLEKTMVMVLNAVGWFVIGLVILSISLKIIKIAFQDRGFENIANNFSLQSVVFVILPPLLISTNSDTLPLLALSIYSAFLIGCFLASSAVMMLGGLLLELFAAETTYTPIAINDNPQFEKQTMELIDKTADEIAESIILIDLELANVIVTKDGTEKVSNEVFRRVFSEDEGLEINEKCVSGKYWHFNITTSDNCKSFREFLKFKTSITENEFVNDWRYSLRKLVRGHINDDYFAEYFDTEETTLQVMLDDLMKEVYRRVESRKTQICAINIYGSLDDGNNKQSSLWFCTKFDYENSKWSAENGVSFFYGMDVLSFYWADKSTDLNIYIHRVQQWALIDDVQNYKKSLEAISSSIASKIEMDDDSNRIMIDTSNMAKAFFSVTHELDVRYRYSSKITEEAFKHLNRIYTAILEASPLVVKNGAGLAETADIDHREQDCAFFGLMCEPVSTKLDESIEENNKYLKASDSGNVIKLLMDYIHQKESVEQNIYSSTTRFTTMIMPALLSSRVAISFYESYKRNNIKDKNPLMSDAQLNQLASAPKLVKNILNILIVVVLCFIIYGIMPLAYVVIVKLLEMIVRLIIHIMLSPVAVITFLWTVNDRQHDEDNVFMPEKIKNIVARTLIDPVSITVSFAVGIMMSLITYKLSKVIVAAISGLMIDQSSISLPIVFVFEVLLNALLAGYIMMKTASVIEYTHKKVVEFIEDNLGVDSSITDEMDQLKRILTLGFK
ncbi:hypothetical protein CTH30272_03050 [Allocatenococcus thiocycli]|nr:hypothetical protein CTH30272_03050 [Catenococcus thiocycli]